jgi:hypothetical protein
MLSLSSREALNLTVLFAGIASQLRAADANSAEAGLYETASRVAFLKAHVLASRERACPIFGEPFRVASCANTIV